MWKQVDVPSRSLVRQLGLGLFVLQASSSGQTGSNGSVAHRGETSVAETAADRELGVETMPIVIVGRVLGPDGRAREGVVVASSAGGRALTDARGEYRLELEVPLDADGVQVTAVAGSLRASTSVAVTGSGTTPSSTLLMEAGDCCTPSWVPTFGEDPGVGGWVYSLTGFDDGSGPSLYVGGQIGSAGGLLVNRIAAWDGSSWSALGSGTDGTVLAQVVFD